MASYHFSNLYYRVTHRTGFSHGFRPLSLRGRGQQRPAAEARAQTPRPPADALPSRVLSGRLSGQSLDAHLV